MTGWFPGSSEASQHRNAGPTFSTYVDLIFLFTARPCGLLIEGSYSKLLYVSLTSRAQRPLPLRLAHQEIATIHEFLFVKLRYRLRFNRLWVLNTRSRDFHALSCGLFAAQILGAICVAL